jgi:hypothetical protein
MRSCVLAQDVRHRKLSVSETYTCCVRGVCEKLCISGTESTDVGAVTRPTIGLYVAL